MAAQFVIGNIAYLITALALLVRDMLWLRMLAAAANAGFILANTLSAAGPAYSFIGWSTLFFLINLYQIANLVIEQHSTRLPEEDEDLHVSVFPNLTVGEFRLLLKAGRRTEFSSGTVLVQQGQVHDDVMLVERGLILLERDGQELAQLRDGDMLGEIAFVAGKPFSSSASVVAPTRILAWERNALSRLFVRRPALAVGFHAAFIGQLRRDPPAPSQAT